MMGLPCWVEPGGKEKEMDTEMKTKMVVVGMLVFVACGGELPDRVGKNYDQTPLPEPEPEPEPVKLTWIQECVGGDQTDLPSIVGVSSQEIQTLPEYAGNWSCFQAEFQSCVVDALRKTATQYHYRYEDLGDPQTWVENDPDTYRFWRAQMDLCVAQKGRQVPYADGHEWRYFLVSPDKYGNDYSQFGS